ncbi:MAG: valine--tRNA ligase [Candidatus Saccharibacteria bacterium]|nr:valine--tRNA ligase [Candidatus Saccharibacteria bacterium]
MKFASAYEPGEFESEIYAGWEAAGVFAPRAVVDDSKSFSIVMPPPNANGNLHIGHGLTIALEDSLTRYHRLKGESAWYIPGADHAGFETWVVYERALEAKGETRFNYSRDELYAQVWDFVQEQRGNMELQVRALGASCSWKDLTFTLDENVVRRVYKTFEKMWKDGMVYRGEKLVNYCPKHQTAFADIEVEYSEDKGKLWDIAYQYDGGEIIVSTTRPETLFGDTAVAVNPEDARYKDLIGSFVKLPLTDREIPIVADEHADPEYGTGAVKITPAHDYDDFEVGLRHDLPRVRVIDDAGKMVGCGPEYDGLSTEECRKKVLKDLKTAGLLRGEKAITHSVAHCYKCGTVIEPTLKEQWFIDVKRLAREAIKHLERDEIKFHPASKKQVLINYLEGLKDWNISRQIPWGIAIPMFRRITPGRSSASTDAMLAHRTLSTAPSGAPSSLNFISAESLPDNSTNPLANESAPEWIFDTRTNLSEIEVGGVRYVRDEDTFDTWFSSSHWPIVCTDWESGQSGAKDGNPYYPLNVMETGADILFAWVARMIMMGIYVTGEVPFREVYLHGLVLDAHGQKMSKSKGNVINPMELVAKYGSDAFRLGILRGRSAGMNQAFSENSVVAGRNLCNKIWNLSRLVQGIVDDSPSETEVEGWVTTENMGEDWICREINSARSLIEKQMQEYRFAEAVETIHSLIWDKYADWFIESQKLYHNVNLLKATLEAILKMLHPFAPFVTETIWQNLSWTEGMIINAEWPGEFEFDPISAENFAKLIEVVSEVRSTMTAISKLPKVEKMLKRGGEDKKVLDAGDVSAEKGGMVLLYGDDSLVATNDILVKNLAKLAAVESCEGQPRGIRLALANHELYLDVPAPVVAAYAEALDERILAVGRELDALNARMMNPNYVDKAPAALVEETRRAIEEKNRLIEGLKNERNLI